MCDQDRFERPKPCSWCGEIFEHRRDCPKFRGVIKEGTVKLPQWNDYEWVTPVSGVDAEELNTTILQLGQAVANLTESLVKLETAFKALESRVACLERGGDDGHS